MDRMFRNGTPRGSVIRIRLIAPYPDIALIAREALKQRDGGDVEVDIIQAAGVHVLEQMNFDADAVISRGVSALALRKILPSHVPLVELKVTGYDVLRAIDWCRCHRRGSQISVIGSRNMVEGAQSVADILKMNLQYKLITGEEDAQSCLEEGLRDGPKIVIGGAFVCMLAKKRHVPFRLIESGRAAVLSALDEAVHVASVALKERVVAERMRM